MINDDTVKLLKECDAGVKMAVSAIDEVLPTVKCERLKQRLITCKQEHEDLGVKAHTILNDNAKSEKEPSPIAKGMSWMKTNMKLSVNPTDNAVADLITDGCNMGVKALNRSLNQYQIADWQAKDITGQLIRSEEQLSVDLRPFL